MAVQNLQNIYTAFENIPWLADVFNTVFHIFWFHEFRIISLNYYLHHVHQEEGFVLPSYYATEFLYIVYL